MSRDVDFLVREHATRHRADDALRARIALSIARQSGIDSSWPPTLSRRWFAPSWSRTGVAFALGLICAVALQPVFQVDAPPAGIAAELVADHKRSLMAEHLTDVASSDRHTVKPWFQGRLDFSPPVFDFVERGFALVGGRLELVAGRPAAALVYRRGGHAINVFVWPADAAGASDRLVTRDGFNAVALQVHEMQLWFVSDLEAAQLRAFAGLWRDAALATDRLVAPGSAPRR